MVGMANASPLAPDKRQVFVNYGDIFDGQTPMLSVPLNPNIAGSVHIPAHAAQAVHCIQVLYYTLVKSARNVII